MQCHHHRLRETQETQVMRSFSKLRVHCNHMETFPDRPSKARDDAAALGTLFHSLVQYRVLSGKWDFDAPEPVAGWLRRMAEVWTPPDDCETEVACGIADGPLRYQEVYEVKPHIYLPSVPGVPRITAAAWDRLDDDHKRSLRNPLITAGRADLVWEEDGVLKVCDIKTGQSYLGPPDRVPQLQGQGLALGLRSCASGWDVRVGVYYARLGMFDWGHVHSATWWQDAVRDAALRDTEPRPGVHCLGCWSKRDCGSYPERRAA